MRIHKETPIKVDKTPWTSMNLSEFFSSKVQGRSLEITVTNVRPLSCREILYWPVHRHAHLSMNEAGAGGSQKAITRPGSWRLVLTSKLSEGVGERTQDTTGQGHQWVHVPSIWPFLLSKKLLQYLGQAGTPDMNYLVPQT